MSVGNRICNLVERIRAVSTRLSLYLIFSEEFLFFFLKEFDTFLNTVEFFITLRVNFSEAF